MTPCDEPQGARHLGVQNMAEACMQGRGVMIDLEAHFGRTGHIVSHAELMEVMRNDHVTVEPGDFVLFRTGFAEMLLEMNKQPDREKLMAGTVGLDGRDPKLQQWVTDCGAVALISDNFAVESHAGAAVPGRCLRHAAAARALPVQTRLLSRRDVLPYRAGRLAARQQPQPFPVHRPAAAPARCGRLACHTRGDGLTLRQGGAAGQVGGLLIEAVDQRLAAAARDQPAEVRALHGDAADRTVGQHIHRLPANRLWRIT